jgi:hypothetical protein
MPRSQTESHAVVEHFEAVAGEWMDWRYLSPMIDNFEA